MRSSSAASARPRGPAATQQRVEVMSSLAQAATRGSKLHKTPRPLAICPAPVR